MDDSKKKRTRVPNFSNDEKILLLHLVDKYRDILECKKTDGTTSRDKKETWKRLAREFNASSYSTEKRTAENIKTCYENLKKFTKKQALTTKVKVLKPGACRTCICNRRVDSVFDLTMSILNKTISGAVKKLGGDESSGKIKTDDENNEIEESLRSESETENVALKSEEKFLQSPEDEEYKITLEADEDCNEIRDNMGDEYENIASLKAEVYRQQLQMMKKEEEYKEKQRRREELEFETQKQRRAKKWELEQKSLLLDIKIKEAQLKNINLNLNLI